ncbi:MAG: hypothetical protein KKH95_05910, partial [Gammaproteobacteria bacterium]|nr:hypothetical protein [Gammaproteobacteria bacterium]
YCLSHQKQIIPILMRIYIHQSPQGCHTGSPLLISGTLLVSLADEIRAIPFIIKNIFTSVQAVMPCCAFTHLFIVNGCG